MAPDRTVSGHRITRSGTAHRVLRSELNDYNVKFKVSLPSSLPSVTGTPMTAPAKTPLHALGRARRRSDTMKPWREQAREAAKVGPAG